MNLLEIEPYIERIAHATFVALAFQICANFSLQYKIFQFVKSIHPIAIFNYKWSDQCRFYDYLLSYRQHEKWLQLTLNFRRVRRLSYHFDSILIFAAKEKAMQRFSAAMRDFCHFW